MYDTVTANKIGKIKECRRNKERMTSLSVTNGVTVVQPFQGQQTGIGDAKSMIPTGAALPITAPPFIPNIKLVAQASDPQHCNASPPASIDLIQWPASKDYDLPKEYEPTTIGQSFVTHAYQYERTATSMRINGATTEKDVPIIILNDRQFNLKKGVKYQLSVDIEDRSSAWQHVLETDPFNEDTPKFGIQLQINYDDNPLNRNTVLTPIRQPHDMTPQIMQRRLFSSYPTKPFDQNYEYKPASVSLTISDEKVPRLTRFLAAINASYPNKYSFNPATKTLTIKEAMTETEFLTINEICGNEDDYNGLFAARTATNHLAKQLSLEEANTLYNRLLQTGILYKDGDKTLFYFPEFNPKGKTHDFNKEFVKDSIPDYLDEITKRITPILSEFQDIPHLRDQLFAIFSEMNGYSFDRFSLTPPADPVTGISKYTITGEFYGDPNMNSRNYFDNVALILRKNTGADITVTGVTLKEILSPTNSTESKK